MNGRVKHFATAMRYQTQPADQIDSAGREQLAAYFDESGTHNGSKVLTLCGVVSPVSQWERLGAAWQRLLEKERLPFFHAADCVGGYDLYEDWPEERRERVYSAFLSLVTRHACWRAWTAFVVDEYLQMFGEDTVDKGHERAYAIGATACISQMAELSERRGVRVCCLFDHGGRGGGWAIKAINGLVEKQREGYHRIISRVGTGNKKDVLPLQAADLHAYEVFRDFGDPLSRPTTRRREMMQLLAIPEVQEAGGHLFTAETFSEWQKAKGTGERIYVRAVKQSTARLERINPYEP